MFESSSNWYNIFVNANAIALSKVALEPRVERYVVERSSGAGELARYGRA